MACRGICVSYQAPINRSVLSFCYGQQILVPIVIGFSGTSGWSYLSCKDIFYPAKLELDSEIGNMYSFDGNKLSKIDRSKLEVDRVKDKELKKELKRGAKLLNYSELTNDT
jgi:hypothetical protein